MTPDQAGQLVDALLKVPWVEWCYCGQPKSAHRFYDDKIYDVQGFKCPGGWGEFRLDSERSFARQREARVQLLLQEVVGDPTGR